MSPTLTRDPAELCIALFDANGCELHRSQALHALLTHSPQSAALIAHIRATLQDALALRRRTAESAAAGEMWSAGWRDVMEENEHYRMRAVFLPAATILLEVERAVAHMPTHAQLCASGLTAREAEVAILLAVGASDREIAQRLDISPHTARKHAEHIFGKLGVHTRKAFLLTLSHTAK